MLHLGSGNTSGFLKRFPVWQPGLTLKIKKVRVNPVARGNLHGIQKKCTHLQHLPHQRWLPKARKVLEGVPGVYPQGPTISPWTVGHQRGVCRPGRHVGGDPLSRKSWGPWAYLAYQNLDLSWDFPCQHK